MDRPPRRLRFYKPTDSPPIPELATRTTTLSSGPHHASPLTASSTPVSRTTPETLRTLEANWRERRRARLEDITLQRAMGVESPAARRTERTRNAQGKEEDDASAEPMTTEMNIRTGRTARTPLKPVTTNLLRTQTPSDNANKMPASDYTPTTRDATTTRRSTSGNRRASMATDDHPTVMGNNTTAQTRTNKARKIVKLVRDARLSVQAGERGAGTRVSEASTVAKEIPKSKTSRQAMTHCPAVTGPTPTLAPTRPSSSSAPIKQPPPRTETSATPRRVSELQRIAQYPTDLSKPSNRRSPRPRWSESCSFRPPELQPITALPLPPREYPLSPSSALIIYPHSSDLSVDGSPVVRQAPTMSAVTATERMDVFDDGTRMRVKSLKTGEARWLDLQNQERWSTRDRRRWEVLADLIARLKSRTRRATYDLPPGTVHIMCNDPPDVVFYTNILEPPPLSKGKPNDTMGETSALLKATTDTAYLCRARILLSPSKASLTISTHYGPSTRDPPAPHTSPHGQSFRSRRIVRLSSPTTPTVQQIQELYNAQKSAITRPAPAASKMDGRFPHEVWQAREVQSLGRFLKMRDVWATRDTGGGG